MIPPPPACDSAVLPCLLGCLAFLQRHSLPPSPPSHPLGPFPSCQQQNSALGLLSNPYTPAPSCHTGDCVPVQGRSGCGKDCLCGSHPIQTVTYQLLHSLTASTVSPLSQTIAPMWGSDPCFNSPTLQVQVQSCSLSSFSLTSFILLSFAWICIFLSSGQGLLPTPSWCSARSSASEDVFLMHPWREMYSTSTYSSAILLPSVLFFK